LSGSLEKEGKTKMSKKTVSSHIEHITLEGMSTAELLALQKLFANLDLDKY